MTAPLCTVARELPGGGAKVDSALGEVHSRVHRRDVRLAALPMNEESRPNRDGSATNVSDHYITLQVSNPELRSFWYPSCVSSSVECFEKARDEPCWVHV